jgi:hypothetical protein
VVAVAKKFKSAYRLFSQIGLSNEEETMQRLAICLAVGLSLLIGAAGSTPASAYYYRHHYYRYHHNHHYYNQRRCYWSHHHNQCRYW